MSNETLPEKLMRLRDNVKDIILPRYKEIGLPATFAIKFVIEPALERANKAITSGDIVLMVNSLKELEDIKE